MQTQPSQIAIIRKQRKKSSSLTGFQIHVNVIIHPYHIVFIYLKSHELLNEQDGGGDIYGKGWRKKRKGK